MSCGGCDEAKKITINVAKITVQTWSEDLSSLFAKCSAGSGGFNKIINQENGNLSSDSPHLGTSQVINDPLSRKKNHLVPFAKTSH